MPPANVGPTNQFTVSSAGAATITPVRMYRDADNNVRLSTTEAATDYWTEDGDGNYRLTSVAADQDAIHYSVNGKTRLVEI